MRSIPDSLFLNIKGTFVFPEWPLTFTACQCCKVAIWFGFLMCKKATEREIQVALIAIAPVRVPTKLITFSLNYKVTLSNNRNSLTPSPFNPPILQHLKGSSESVLWKFNFYFFFFNVKTC